MAQCFDNDDTNKHDVHYTDDDGGNDRDVLASKIPSTINNNRKNRQHKSNHYKVVIVGAGASGLQCCNTLMKEYNASMDDILILEARSRIGGRIYTTLETANVVTTVVSDKDNHYVPNQQQPLDSEREVPVQTTSTTTTFALDHGAAWVHGTGFDIGTTIPNTFDEEKFNATYDQDDDDDDNDESSSDNDRPDTTTTTVNPMMYLLEQHASTMRKTNFGSTKEEEVTSNGTGEGDDTNNNTFIYEQRFGIHPIVNGNPWMRPRSILHDHGQLGLYVAGRYIGGIGGHNESGSDCENNSTAADAGIVQLALRRHYNLLRRVQSIGNEMYDSGRGLETTTTSLADTVQMALPGMQEKVITQPDHDDTNSSMHPSEEQMVAAMAPFYMLLLECWYGCESSAMQLNEFVEDNDREMDQEDHMYRNAGDFIGPHCAVANGMMSVLQPLLQNGVQERILCNQEVIAIQYHQHQQPDSNGTTNGDDTSTASARTVKNYISIETADGLQVTADTCVVTIPAGCLKEAVLVEQMFRRNTIVDGGSSSDGGGSVRQQQPLSPAKMESISLLQMGSYKKIFLTFDHIFWPAQPAFIGLVRHIDHDSNTDSSSENEMYYKTTSTHLLGNCILVDNLWAKRGIASMEVVLFGLAGKWSIGKSDTELRDAILDFISDSMSISRTSLQESYVSCHVTRWEEDKYSRGAYSSTALGILPRHLRELRRPEWDDRLIFSGEATISEYDGSVFAALYSGRNAANSVNKCLSREKEVLLE